MLRKVHRDRKSVGIEKQEAKVMLEDFRNRLLRVTATGIVIVILLLQGSTIVFMALGKPMGTWYWPIIDYPMYSAARYEGERINAYYNIDVVLKDGSLIAVTADDVGLNFWKFLYIGDGIKRSRKQSAELLIALHPDGENITEIRVYGLPYVLGKDGMYEAEPKLLNSIVLK